MVWKSDLFITFPGHPQDLGGFLKNVPLSSTSARQAPACPADRGQRRPPPARLLDEETSWSLFPERLSLVLILFLSPSFSPSLSVSAPETLAVGLRQSPPFLTSPGSGDPPSSSASPPRTFQPKESAREAFNRRGRHRLPRHWPPPPPKLVVAPVIPSHRRPLQRAQGELLLLPMPSPRPLTLSSSALTCTCPRPPLELAAGRVPVTKGGRRHHQSLPCVEALLYPLPARAIAG
jgi:hypothetical protein